MKLVNHAYFGIKLGDKDRTWAPHAVCKSYERNWSKGRKKSLCFGIPNTEREQKNYVDDFYFRPYNTSGYNKKNQKEIN